MKFKKCDVGLYFYNKNNKEDHEYNIDDSNISYMFYNRVSDNAQLMTNREIEAANKALVYQEFLGWPSTSEFKKMVSNNLIQNCDKTANVI